MEKKAKNLKTLSIETIKAQVAAGEISKKELAAGGKEIVAMCSTLKQVLNQFSGCYNTPLKETKGVTVSQWLEVHGIKRSKNAAGKYKPLKACDIFKAWEPDMQVEKRVAVYGNKTAVWYKEQGEGKDPIRLKVYTKGEMRKEVEKGSGHAITRYCLKEIGETAWSVRIIVRAFTQMSDLEKHQQKEAKSNTEINTLTGRELFAVEDVKDADGNLIDRVAHPVKLEDVVFE